MQKLSIVTIHKGPISNLRKTLDSVIKQEICPFEQIVITPKLPANFISRYNKSFLKFLVGKDKSIYNAMNIGLRHITGNNVIFLNSGDEFFGKNAIKLIVNKINLKKNKILIFKILLKYKNLKFIPKKNYFDSKTYFPHPVFVVPTTNYNKKIYFNENNETISDGEWIRKNLNKFNYEKFYNDLVIHDLGGVSTKPTYKLALEKKRVSTKEYFKELFKLFLFKIVNEENYYKLIFKYKYNLINE